MTATSDFHYDLPQNLIAQEPAPERAESGMMALHRDTGAIEHRCVSDLPAYLNPGDLLVVNDTKVIPARVFGCRSDTGGKVELLLLESVEPDTWLALYRASRPARPGIGLDLADSEMAGEIVAVRDDGKIVVKLSASRPIRDVLETKGFAPVPPYIRRDRGGSRLAELDRTRYQTVYARVPGAVAAPTAGLHFTAELLDGIRDKGVGVVPVTLHVGIGTFRPVKTDTVENHVMDEERYSVGGNTARAIEETRRRGGRIVAVGTTTVRVLETVAARHGKVAPGEGRTDLFIYPPYEFRMVDAILTNFHLPASTLIMMISAFAGRELVLKAYREAVSREYRFYSYGDCMLIL